jgi:hypothetical protein
MLFRLVLEFTDVIWCSWLSFVGFGKFCSSLTDGSGWMAWVFAEEVVLISS